MKIKILTAGGTIDKVYFDAKGEFEVGPPQVTDLLRDANVAFAFTIEPILRKDSLDMTDEDRERVRRRVAAARCARIVITHGTDTMVRTALALRKIRGKTIVLTGSMQPARFRATDAAFNLGAAIAAVQTLPPGVYLAMNGCIFDPARVRKNRARLRFEIAGDLTRRARSRCSGRPRGCCGSGGRPGPQGRRAVC
jgi:L-asparaginase